MTETTKRIGIKNTLGNSLPMFGYFTVKPFGHAEEESLQVGTTAWRRRQPFSIFSFSKNKRSLSF